MVFHYQCQVRYLSYSSGTEGAWAFHVVVMVVLLLLIERTVRESLVRGMLGMNSQGGILPSTLLFLSLDGICMSPLESLPHSFTPGMN